MINLPFLHVNSKNTMTRNDAHDGGDINSNMTQHSKFEHEMKSSEAEFDKQNLKQQAKSSDQSNIKQSSDSESKVKSNDDTQADEQSVNQKSAKDDTNVSESDDVQPEQMVAKEAENSNIDLVSLNEVLAQLAANLNQTTTEDTKSKQTDSNSFDNSNLPTDDFSATEIGMYEAAGIDLSSVREVKQSLNQNRNAKVQEHKTKNTDENNTGNNQQTIAVNTNDFVGESNQIDHEADKEELNTEDVEVKNANEEEVKSNILSQISGKDNSLSNTSNVVSLQDFNYFKASQTQEKLDLKLETIDSRDPHVIAMASKSLLSAIDHDQITKVDQAIKQVLSKSTQFDDIKLPQTTMNEIVDARNVINQVLQGMQNHVKQDSQQIQIRLDPPEWGAIHVKMNVANNEVNLTLLTENQSIKEALDKGVQALRGQFMQNGLNLGNVNIGVGNGSQNAEKEAREQLSDEEKKIINKTSSTPKSVASRSGLIKGVESVIDSHV